MNEFQWQEQTPIMPECDLRRDRLRIGIPMLAVALVFLVTMVAQTVLHAVVSAVAPGWTAQSWYTWALSMVPMYAIAMPLSLLLYRTVPAEVPKKRNLSIPAWLGLLAICFALTYVGNIVGMAVNNLIGAISGHMPENDLSNTATQAPFWSNLLFLGILAPIMEEIFYRKMVLDRLSRYGDLPAILISGVVFGLIHGNFSQFFYAAAIGILFGYVYLKTGKIRYTITLHMGVNLIGGVYSAEMLRRMQLMDPDATGQGSVVAMLKGLGGIAMMMAYLLFMAVVFVGAPIALAKMVKRIRFAKSEQPLTAKQWIKVLLLNPGMWVLAAVVCMLFAMAVTS